MTQEETEFFINLLLSHRHLWMTFQEYRYLQENPGVDWETAHEKFLEESEDSYQAVADALLDGQPLEDKLQTVISQSDLAQTEVLKELKRR
jgi:hypothetical protein